MNIRIGGIMNIRRIGWIMNFRRIGWIMNVRRPYSSFRWPVFYGLG